jgi:hypothetical protein
MAVIGVLFDMKISTDNLKKCPNCKTDWDLFAGNTIIPILKSTGNL